MPKMSTYYVGRIHKINLDDSKLIKAIKNPARIKYRKHSWTFINVQTFMQPDKKLFLFGNLAKYLPHALLPQVDEDEHESRDIEVDRFMVAASSFVYLPGFSGIAYQHIWNKIEHKTFRLVFSELIKAAFGNFFVSCEIEPIVEYIEFVKKIHTLKRITRLKSAVHPPNPLYGRLWKSLREYLAKRELDELRIKEDAGKDGNIKTELPKILDKFTQKAPSAKIDVKGDLDIGDASVLMAADGYGKASVEGHDGKRTIIVKTLDITKNFRFDAEPDASSLYEVAYSLFKEISQSRYLEGGKHDVH